MTIRWFGAVGLCLALTLAGGGTPALAAQAPDAGVPAASPNSVERDAQEYTRLVLRHDSLAFKQDMRQATTAEIGELPGLRAQGEAIARLYGPGGPKSAQAAAYKKRVAQLSATIVADARRTWIADAFPGADAVLRAYPDSAQRLAALKIVLDLLESKVRPSPPSAADKKNAYRRAITQLEPPQAFNAALFEASQKLTGNGPFRTDVISRFVPIYGSEAARASNAAGAATAARNGTQLFWASVIGVCLLALAVPLVSLVSSRHESGSGVIPVADPTFHLPPGLTRVSVFRRSYDLNYDGGTITACWDFYDGSRPGGARSPGLTTAQFTDGSTRLVESDTPSGPPPNRCKCTFDTRDGRHEERSFDKGEFWAEVGAITGFISCGSEGLLYYDYTTHTLTQTKGVATLHRVNGTVLWWISVAVAVIGLASIASFLLPRLTSDNPLLGAAIVPWILLIAVFSAVFIGIVKKTVEAIRNGQFRARFKPALAEFMKAQRRPGLPISPRESARLGVRP